MDNGSSQDALQLEEGEQVEPQYEGEDTRLTSRKELSGWYSYGFAAEVFAICAMGKCPTSGFWLFHQGFVCDVLGLLKFTVSGAAPANPLLDIVTVPAQTAVTELAI
jgi:hypothetical protein